MCVIVITVLQTPEKRFLILPPLQLHEQQSDNKVDLDLDSLSQFVFLLSSHLRPSHQQFEQRR